MGWFNRRKRADVELIDSLLNAENNRRAMQLKVDEQELSLRMRKQELEFEHLDALSEQRRKDREDAAKLKEQRREWAATAREKKRGKEAANASTGGNHQREAGGCRVCADGGNPTLTSEEILWHHNGHRAAM